MTGAPVSPSPALAGAAVVCALAATMVAPPTPVLLWNTTASAPLGIYGISPTGEPNVGDWVAVRPSSARAAWLAAGGFLAPDTLLLKRVAAVRGQGVCRIGAVVLVDGRPSARALARSRTGAPLPTWRGCYRLKTGELFLLNPAPASLDGRYLGVTTAAQVVGRAHPLWTWLQPS